MKINFTKGEKIKVAGRVDTMEYTMELEYISQVGGYFSGIYYEDYIFKYVWGSNIITYFIQRVEIDGEFKLDIKEFNHVDRTWVQEINKHTNSN